MHWLLSSEGDKGTAYFFGQLSSYYTFLEEAEDPKSLVSLAPHEYSSSFKFILSWETRISNILWQEISQISLGDTGFSFAEVPIR